jgi:DUF917 family protein
MSNALYDLGRNAFLKGEIAYLTDTIKAALIDGTYVPDLSTDQFWSTVVGSVVGTPQILANKTTTAGVANATPTTFSSVVGSVVQYIVIYKDTGVNSTSPLIAFIDTGTGLPVTPNGGDITINWDTGASKIFKL